MVLVQPAELVIIGGAALGTLLIANPLPTVIKIFTGILGILSGSKYTEDYYLEGLKLLHDIFQFARKSGMAKSKRISKCRIRVRCFRSIRS
jgi:chemotaxis protein MotA